LGGNGDDPEINGMKAIEEAEEGLLEALEGGEEIPPRDLRRKVLEESALAPNSPEATEVSLAFWRLLNRGEIELTEDLTIRRAQPQAAA
jgi:hypothetical protein